MLVNGSELLDRRSQCGAFASYYEDLAAPKNHPNFGQEYLDSPISQEAVIGEITMLKPDELILIDKKRSFSSNKISKIG